MATGLMTIREPEEAFLVFKKQNSRSLHQFELGSTVTLANVKDPDRQITATVVSMTELALRSNEFPYFIKDSYVSTGRLLFQQNLHTFKIEGNKNSDDTNSLLTLKFLTEQVLPIISSLVTVQKILFGSEPTIKLITQNSPVKVSMEGAGSLYEKVATDVIPWRRAHAKQIAALDESKARAELEQKKAEILTAEAKTQQEIADSETASQRARKAKMEADLKGVELIRARFELAIDMVNKMYPGPMSAEKTLMVAQLLPELTALTGTAVLISVEKSQPH
jgi:hypothetical protein